MKTPNYTITSISQYLGLLKEIGYPMLYRGQTKDWPLLPSIARHQSFASREPIELEAIILEKLVQYGYPHFHNSITQESDWLLHAQHYGLPTRLLDFTTNPLKALFFATTYDSSKTDDGVVWCVDIVGENTFPRTDTKKLIFYNPTHVNSRITAQESVFAVFPLEFGKPHVAPLDEIKGEHRMWAKIIIPAECKKSIRKELGIIGINQMTIFHSIEGVIEKIKEECELDVNI